MNNRTLVMLTSTRDPYINDILDLLFLPSGSVYRFRYRQKWLPEHFRNPEIVDEINDIECLLVHIDVGPQTNGNYPLREFIPVRKSKILEVKYLEEILWISFELGDWIKYEKNNENGVNEHHDAIKKITPNGSKEKVGDILYIVEQLDLKYISDTYDDDNSHMIQNWFRIVDHIKKLLDHKRLKSIFLKLISIKNLNSGDILKPIRINKVVLNKKIISEYEYKSDSEYLIELLQYYPNSDITPFLYKLNLDDKKFIGLKVNEKIQGRYDVLRFIFKTIKSDKDAYSYLQFIKNGNNSKNHIISEPFMLIKYVGDKIKTYLLYIGITLGLILTAIAKEITGEPPYDIVVIIIAAFGSILTTLLLYLLREQ